MFSSLDFQINLNYSLYFKLSNYCHWAIALPCSTSHDTVSFCPSVQFEIAAHWPHCVPLQILLPASQLSDTSSFLFRASILFSLCFSLCFLHNSSLVTCQAQSLDQHLLSFALSTFVSSWSFCIYLQSSASIHHPVVLLWQHTIKYKRSKIPRNRRIIAKQKWRKEGR